jgi:hypothetical protein
MGHLDCCILLLAYGCTNITDSQGNISSSQMKDLCSQKMQEMSTTRSFGFAMQRALVHGHEKCAQVLQRFCKIAQKSELKGSGAISKDECSLFIAQSVGISVAGARAHELAVLATSSTSEDGTCRDSSTVTSGRESSGLFDRQPHSPDGAAGGVQSPVHATSLLSPGKVGVDSNDVVFPIPGKYHAGHPLSSLSAQKQIQEKDGFSPTIEDTTNVQQQCAALQEQVQQMASALAEVGIIKRHAN